MKSRWVESPNWSRRRSDTVDAIVLHYTALLLNDTIARFEDSGSRVSAHFVIDRDGSVIQMVRTEHKAWHAGTSQMDGRRDVNDYSIGIELINWGPLKKRDGNFYVWKDNWSQRYDGKKPQKLEDGYWDPYTEAQYDALVRVITHLRTEYPGITRERVKGHSEVCLPDRRKIDPGPAFDLERVLAAVFG